MLHTKFPGHWFIRSREEDFLRFLPYMDIGIVLLYSMLHIKFQGHWSIGSGEEDF